METISIIIPCYNEEESLPFLYPELIKLSDELCDYNLEFIFVNDGSKDNTLELLRLMSEQDDRVKFVSFSRNFGKEAAIFAGLEKSKGEYVTLIDADLQDPPHLIITMIDEIKNNGYDCVATKRETRTGEPFMRSLFAKIFYKTINKISKTQIMEGARDFRLMTRKMVNAIISLKEYNRFSKGIFSWVGFKTKWISYENINRVAGKTKWSFWGLARYSIDGFVGFSTAPLKIAAISGLVCCGVSVVLCLFYFIKALIFGDAVEGFPTTIVLILFLGGLQLLCLGILSQYVEKMYLETKKRPIYIVEEEN